MSTPRTRRPRGSLTPDAILDAAEAIAADRGTLSMRAVAARLEAVPMALYNHFATKDALVDGLLDRVLARFEPAPPTDDWSEDLRRFAEAHRRLLKEHPWAVAALFARPNPGPAAVRIGEHAFAILARGGAVWVAATAASWPIAWLASSGVVDLDRGWHAFGSSGAIVVALVTGLALRGRPTFFTRKTRVAGALSGS